MAPRSDATSGPPSGVPELELDVRPSAGPRAKSKVDPAPDTPLELAVDPRSLVQERSAGFSQGPRFGPPTPAAIPPQGFSSADPALAAVPDVAFDAHVLADYGEPPRHWFFSPLYTYRVLRRRKELRAALMGRQEEAARAADEVEDALVALAERARTAAEKSALYALALQELRAAEELLRSRDKVLAADQDAHHARLSQVDARLSSLESELAQAQSEERRIASELAEAQGALGREEARLKRAEIELRAANQRASGGGGGTGG